MVIFFSSCWNFTDESAILLGFLENFTTREFPSDKQLISVFYEDSKFVNSWFHGSRLVSDTQYMSGFFNKRNSKLKKYHVRLFPISRVGSTVEFMNCGASWVWNSQSGLSPRWSVLTRSCLVIIYGSFLNFALKGMDHEIKGQ